MVRRILISVGMVALGLGAILPGAGRAAAASPVLSPPQHYYLSLGDSVAFGYQQFKVDAQLPNVNPATFNTGYTDDLAAMLAVVRPDIQTVNYGCPGQTTSEFISSPDCPSYPFPLHAGYSGSQLDAALAFLQAHPGQVSPITISLGPNDLLRLTQSCGGTTPAAVPCVISKLPDLLNTVGTNMAKILVALRQAAPNAEIIALQPYNPVAANPSLAATSNQVAQALGRVIAQAAAPAGAVVADAFTPFNLAPNEPATLCRLSLICTPKQDIHPTDAGYAVIAQQIWNASGYGKLASLFVVGFDSSQPGQGKVYFGTGPGCSGLVQVGTRDIHPGTTTHAVVVMGNDLPGTVGDIGLLPGGTYWYETVTATSSGEQIDNNDAACYSTTISAS